MNFTQDLIDRIIEHDDLAFAQFYEQSVDVFFSYLSTRYSLSDAEIHDILSDVYLKIWNNIKKYNPDYQFGQFVWTILKNHTKDYFKKHKSIQFSDISDKHDNMDASDILNELIADDNVVDLFNQKFDQQRIHKALHMLNKEDQTIIHARYILGYSYETLSYLLNISPSAARKRLSRALTELRNQLT